MADRRFVQGPAAVRSGDAIFGAATGLGALLAAVKGQRVLPGDGRWFCPVVASRTAQ